MEAQQLKEAQKPEVPKNALPVSVALLHQPITIAPTIPSDKTLNKTKMPGCSMLWTPQGLVVKHKGVTVVIGQSNVACVVLED